MYVVCGTHCNSELNSQFMECGCTMYVGAVIEVCDYSSGH